MPKPDPDRPAGEPSASANDGDLVSLRGAVAVVTGGARRLGRAIALALAETGCDVVINFRSAADDAEDTARRVRAAGVRALVYQADVSQEHQVDALLHATLQTFGRADVLVANAGALRHTPITTLTPGDWNEMLRDNLRTAFLCTHRFGLHMRAHGGGALLTLADVAGIRPWTDYLPYSVAKACVIALTQALATELAPAVRVNALAPGPVLFPEGFDPTAQQRAVAHTLLRRQGAPAHVAAAAVALLRNPYITGAVLPVDGGRLLG